MTASTKDLPRWNSAIQSPFGAIGFKGYDPHNSLLFFVGVVEGTEHLKIGALPNNLDYDFILNDHHIMCLKQGAELHVAEISREKNAFAAWNPRWRIVLNMNEVIYDLLDTYRERPHRVVRLEGFQRGRNVLSLASGAFGEQIPPVDILAVVIAKRVTTQEALDSCWKRLPRAGPEIVIDAKGTIRLSLVDLTTGKQLRFPAKGKHCRHIQPFDLEHFLGQSQRDGFTWLCPLCAQSCQWQELVVDKRAEELLQDPPTGHTMVAVDTALWSRDDLPANMAIADVPIEKATVDVQPVSAGKLFAPRGPLVPPPISSSPFGGRPVAVEPPKPTNAFASFGPGAKPAVQGELPLGATSPMKSLFSFGPQSIQERSPGLQAAKVERPGAIGYTLSQSDERSRSAGLARDVPQLVGKDVNESPFGPRLAARIQPDQPDQRRQRSEFAFGQMSPDAAANGHPQRSQDPFDEEDRRLPIRPRASGHSVVKARHRVGDSVGGIDELNPRRRTDIIVDSNPVRPGLVELAASRAVDPFDDVDLPASRQSRAGEMPRYRLPIHPQEGEQHSIGSFAAVEGLRRLPVTNDTEAQLLRRRAMGDVEDRLVRRSGDVFPGEERAVRRRVDPFEAQGELFRGRAVAQQELGGMRPALRSMDDDFDERLPQRLAAMPADDQQPLLRRRAAPAAIDPPAAQTRLRVAPLDSEPVLRSLPTTGERAARQTSTLSDLYDRGLHASGGIVDLDDRRPMGLPALSGRSVDPFLEMQRRALGPGEEFEEFVEVPQREAYDPFEDELDARHRVMRRR